MKADEEEVERQWKEYEEFCKKEEIKNEKKTIHKR